MKTLQQKIESKLEKQHSDLESSIMWLNIRRFISAAVIVLGALAMYAGSADAGFLFFFVFVLPALIIYAVQTNKEKKLQAKLLDLEKTILSNKG